MRVLVTGVSGFVGRHLAAQAAAQGHEVFGLVRNGGTTAIDDVEFVVGDIQDPTAVARAVAHSRPDRVFHLAAQSYPGPSWDAPLETFRANIEGTINVLGATQQHAPAARLVVAGSSAAYAPATAGRQIREDDPTIPSSPYGASKLAADHFTLMFSRRHGLRAMVARPFFLVGPGKTGDVSSDWAKQLVQLERDGGGEMTVGSLEVVRDFLDIRDGVTGLMRIAEHGVAGTIYNICSGSGWKLSDYLQLFLQSSTAKVVVKPSGVTRPIEEIEKVGCPDRLKSLGWSAQHDIRDTVAKILEQTRREPTSRPNCRS